MGLQWPRRMFAHAFYSYVTRTYVHTGCKKSLSMTIMNRMNSTQFRHETGVYIDVIIYNLKKIFIIKILFILKHDWEKINNNVMKNLLLNSPWLWTSMSKFFFFSPSLTAKVKPFPTNHRFATYRNFRKIRFLKQKIRLWNGTHSSPWYASFINLHKHGIFNNYRRYLINCIPHRQLDDDSSRHRRLPTKKKKEKRKKIWYQTVHFVQIRWFTVRYSFPC